MGVHCRIAEWVPALIILFEQERFRIVFFIRRLRERSFIVSFFPIIFFFTFKFHRSKAAWATLFFNILRGNKRLFVTRNGRW